ncbi:alpha-amylase family protein [Alteromonas stellipolaris]|uniref:alpha-amylase family protein n=1 Tax=Alteromonas stellipolaris TaxID=233316 RepID=UPI0027368685|nr:alpha-amylase family protein [Alteromonas stellipolaris]MDP2537131.1 glycoside hydrolase family 42 [Alteromonas stellipolaris]
MKRQFKIAALAPLMMMGAACTQVENTVNTSSNIKQVNQVTAVSKLETTARSKINVLETMMDQARAKNIDVTREEAVVWFANQFLKFANWDEANPKAIEAAFGYERHFAPNKQKLAADLPNFERSKVIDIVDSATEQLGKVLRNEITRRPVIKVDWQNTKAADDMFVSNGKPIFLYDYFSKSVGQPLGQPDVYNDYLGALYHGGENLYPVDHDRAINSFLVKEDGSFDEDLLKELTEIPDDNIGYLVAWLMGIPEWVEAKEPEIRKGRSLFQGFDLDNPLAREVWSKILRKAAEVTKDKKVIELGFVLANEPHWYSETGHWTGNYEEMQDISSYTLAEFQSWLNKKYSNNISQLNENWDTSFDSFADVNIEIPINADLRGKPIWFDWNRYNMHRATSWFTFMQDELHAVNPEADTHIKIFPRTFYEDSRSHGIDIEALTELTTMIGHDAKALGSPSIRPHISSDWWEKYTYKWDGMSMIHDFTESVSPHKINVNSESHFLSSGQWKIMDPRVSYVRNVYWLATLQGMDANMGWFWMRDPDGSPEDRLEGELNFFDPGLAGAFAGSNNMQPHVANEVTQVMFDMNSFSEEIMALRKQSRPIRLFYSETSAINVEDYMSKQGELYKSMFFEGFPLGYATENIIKKQDNTLWDTVVVYNTPNVTDSEFNALQAYLNAGGSVVVDAESLMFNEYGHKRTKALEAREGSLKRLAPDSGISTLKSVALEQVNLASLPDIEFDIKSPLSHKTTITRVVHSEEDKYLVNLLSVGHEPVDVSLSHRNGGNIKVTNLMTGNEVSPSFVLASEEVLLLEVESIN